MSTLIKPTVLCFSHYDPIDGVGIQADIETLVSHQGHACSVNSFKRTEHTQHQKVDSTTS